MEEEYYSFEQFICAGIACFSSVLLLEDIKRLYQELCVTYPQMIMINDTIRYTNEYIDYTPNFCKLNINFKLKMLGIYDNEEITLKEYLKLIAGDKLVSFMQSRVNEHFEEENKKIRQIDF